jgi:CDP-diacylglycerol---glycerol-3-phosphate 3-phosphatidyltransferase
MCSGADRRVANLITVIRLVVLFGTVGLLYTGQPLAVSFAVVLVYIIIASDALDGIVARRRGRADEFGAIFDIAGDRVVEMVFWIVFADLDVIPVWIPLAMVTRGFLVDALRSLGLKEGKTAFGKNTMMKSPVTKWLTGSRFMRAFYGVAKVLAFGFLAGLYGARLPNTNWFLTGYDSTAGKIATWFFVYSAVILSFVRGLPVVYDSWDYLRGQAPEQQQMRQQFLEARRQRREQEKAVRTPETPGD